MRDVVFGIRRKKKFMVFASLPIIIFRFLFKIPRKILADIFSADMLA